ncbi:hypothetical protein STEG23_032473, partial [Scotinomys teguina]
LTQADTGGSISWLPPQTINQEDPDVDLLLLVDGTSTLCGNRRRNQMRIIRTEEKRRKRRKKQHPLGRRTDYDFPADNTGLLQTKGNQNRNRLKALEMMASGISFLLPIISTSREYVISRFGRQHLLVTRSPQALSLNCTLTGNHR